MCTQHPAAAPHTPSSARRGARDARDRTSHGPCSASSASAAAPGGRSSRRRARRGCAPRPPGGARHGAAAARTCHTAQHGASWASPTAEGACRAGTRPRVCSAASRTLAPRCPRTSLWHQRSPAQVPARGPRSLLVAGVTRRRAEPACGRAATTRWSTRRVDRPRPRGRHPRGPGSGTESGAARPRAPWACEDEGESKTEADVSVKQGLG